MSAGFTLTKEYPQDKPNVIIFHLGGWLDAQSEQELVDAVKQAKDGGAEYVLLEMSKMDVVTSAGIRAMQRAYQILTPREQAQKVQYLKLSNAPAQIYQVLRMVGFLMNAPMYENAQDAVESFGT